MATVPTFNSTATASWTLLRTSSGNETWSISFEGTPTAIAITTNSTAPLASVVGSRVPASGTNVTLSNGDRLWGKKAGQRPLGEETQFSLTGDT